MEGTSLLEKGPENRKVQILGVYYKFYVRIRVVLDQQSVLDDFRSYVTFVIFCITVLSIEYVIKIFN